jgi:hypothetical protein
VFCPSCGAPESGVVVETPSDSSADTGDGTGEVAARGIRRGTLLTGAGIAAVVIIAALAIGHGRNNNSSSASPTTSAASTSTTESSGRTTLPTSPGVGLPLPPTPTTRPATTVRLTGTGPVLPSRTGTVVWASVLPSGHNGTDIVRYDLDTGDVSRVTLPLQGGFSLDLLPRTGGVLVGGAGLRFVSDDGAVANLSQQYTTVLPGPRPDEFYAGDALGRAGPVQVVPGAVATSPVALPLGAQPIGTDDNGGVLAVLNGSSSTYRVDATSGKVELVDPGRVLAMRDGTVVSFSCDAKASCQITARTAAGRSLVLERGAVLDGRVAAIAKGGRWAAVTALGSGGEVDPARPNDVVVADLQTGAIASYPASLSMQRSGGLGWSDDGRYVFWSTPSAVVAWHPGDPPIVVDRAPFAGTIESVAFTTEAAG